MDLGTGCIVVASAAGALPRWQGVFFVRSCVVGDRSVTEVSGSRRKGRGLSCEAGVLCAVNSGQRADARGRYFLIRFSAFAART